MSENSKISWTTHTFNPWMGCTKVSAGCANCYAENLMDTRYGKTKWGKEGLRVIKADSGWSEPKRWNAKAKATGERHRVFCASLADVFEWKDTMPESAWADVQSARLRLLALIDATPHLDWLLLTKRPERFYEVIAALYDDTDWDARGQIDDVHDMLRDWQLLIPPTNVWIGTSCENQQTADERIPHLLKCPAAVRFLSCEPLLGAIDLNIVGDGLDERGADGPTTFSGVSWVIVGGESGRGARPCYTNWIDSLVAQCRAARVPVFVKQMGSNHRCVDDEFGDVPIDLKDSKGGNIEEFPEDLRVRQYPAAQPEKRQ